MFPNGMTRGVGRPALDASRLADLPPDPIVGVQMIGSRKHESAKRLVYSPHHYFFFVNFVEKSVLSLLAV